MEFDRRYKAFIRNHVKQRNPHSANRIKEGLDHASELFLRHVWWPAFHNFNELHPEYEVSDFKDGYRYIDFAYIRLHFKVAIEIDGIGTHWNNISQSKFSEHIQRQNHLVIDGWLVIRFTGDLTGTLQALKVVDREIIRLAMGYNRPITARDVATHLQLSRASATRHLKYLAGKGFLTPASGQSRIRSYDMHSDMHTLQI
jgi:hypothetical protein